MDDKRTADLDIHSTDADAESAIQRGLEVEGETGEKAEGRERKATTWRVTGAQSKKMTKQPLAIQYLVFEF